MRRARRSPINHLLAKDQGRPGHRRTIYGVRDHMSRVYLRVVSWLETRSAQPSPSSETRSAGTGLRWGLGRLRSGPPHSSMNQLAQRAGGTLLHSLPLFATLTHGVFLRWPSPPGGRLVVSNSPEECAISFFHRKRDTTNRATTLSNYGEPAAHGGRDRGEIRNRDGARGAGRAARATTAEGEPAHQGRSGIRWRRMKPPDRDGWRVGEQGAGAHPGPCEG